MEPEELRTHLIGITDARFAGAEDLLRLAAAADDVKITASTRLVPAFELIDAYRTRLLIARRYQRDVEAEMLDAIVELLVADPTATWTLVSVRGGDILGVGFVSARDGAPDRVGCFAIVRPPTREDVGEPSAR